MSPRIRLAHVQFASDYLLHSAFSFRRSASSISSFLPKNDVFISYAHIDDQPMMEGQRCARTLNAQLLTLK